MGTADGTKGNTLFEGSAHLDTVLMVDGVHCLALADHHVFERCMNASVGDSFRILTVFGEHCVDAHVGTSALAENRGEDVAMSSGQDFTETNVASQSDVGSDAPAPGVEDTSIIEGPRCRNCGNTGIGFDGRPCFCAYSQRQREQ